MLKFGVRLADDSFVCTLEDGSPMQPTFITHEWVRAIRGTTVPHYRFHDLRHAHGTHMLASAPTLKWQANAWGTARLALRWTSTATSTGNAGGCRRQNRCGIKGSRKKAGRTA